VGDVRERGLLFVISAPSGTGKSSLARRMLVGLTGLEFSVSYTTRRRREGEVDGREYFFVDDASFDAMLRNGEMLEWAVVFDRRYGTSRAATDAVLASGRDLLLDIDVQGARQVRAHGAPSVSMFVLPPDFAALESRLRSRGSESEGEIERRLGRARPEAEEFEHYDYVVVNDDIERAAEELRAIVRAERSRRERRTVLVRRILETFPARVAGATEN
jgi:guanylate kinase